MHFNNFYLSTAVNWVVVTGMYIHLELQHHASDHVMSHLKTFHVFVVLLVYLNITQCSMTHISECYWSTLLFTHVNHIVISFPNIYYLSFIMNKYILFIILQRAHEIDATPVAKGERVEH